MFWYTRCILYSFLINLFRIYGKFDGTQLKALSEFLPNDDERKGLNAYLLNASKNESSRQDAIDALCPCEKYMVAMMDVPDAREKFKCMIFQFQFRSRISEIQELVQILSKACYDVKHSSRLRKLVAIILTIVNQINTGGVGNADAGFTLDALLKLNEVSGKKQLLKFISSRKN